MDHKNFVFNNVCNGHPAKNLTEEFKQEWISDILFANLFQKSMFSIDNWGFMVALKEIKIYVDSIKWSFFQPVEKKAHLLYWWKSILGMPAYRQTRGLNTREIVAPCPQCLHWKGTNLLKMVDLKKQPALVIDQ